MPDKGNAFIAADDIEIGFANKFHFGFLAFCTKLCFCNGVA